MAERKVKSKTDNEDEVPSRIASDPMAVTWLEKHNKTLEKYWNKLPNFLGSFIASVAVFILGSSIRGEAARTTVNSFTEKSCVCESIYTLS